MKKTLLSLVAALLFIGGAYAQTEQGRIMAGGSLGVGFGTTTNEFPGGDYEEKKSNISINPKAGYFITDGFAVGLGLDINSQTAKYEDDGDDEKETISSLAVNPFVRYYSPVGLFGEVSVSFGSAKYKYEETGGVDDETKNKLFGWSLGAGYAIFLNDNVSIEPMVSYNQVNLTNSDNSDFKTKNGQFMVEVGFNIFL